MQENVEVKGIVLKSEPAGEYDRRVVILTDTRGKISAFAKGARRPNSRFVAVTAPFTFATFRLYEGRNSYSLNDVEVHNHFEELRNEYNNAYYGMYMLEIADYYTRENNDEKEMLKLLYQSLRALTKQSLDNRLVRVVYEIRSTVVNGEFPGPKDNARYKKATLYAIDHIVQSSIEKLYTFAVKPDVLTELEEIAADTCRQTMNYPFKSLEILNTLI